MTSLTHSAAHSTINPDGAWVEALSDDNRPILFPKTEFENGQREWKTRGGMHVCLPNFGPGGESGLAQHGFGRTSTWSILQQTASEVALVLHPDDTVYHGLEAILQYALGSKSFSATVTLKNNGQTPLRVTPGFHPYFALDENETTVTVNGVTYELSNLADTEFLTTDSVELVTATRTLNLTQTSLSTWAIWTDLLGRYVCVEPTYGGYRFLENATPDELLAPGAEKTYSCTISW